MRRNIGGWRGSLSNQGESWGEGFEVVCTATTRARARCTISHTHPHHQPHTNTNTIPRVTPITATATEPNRCLPSISIHHQISIEPTHMAIKSLLMMKEGGRERGAWTEPSVVSLVRAYPGACFAEIFYIKRLCM